MKPNKLILLFVASLLVGTVGRAEDSGRTIGNGGDGLIIGNRVHLLDLVEAGVQDAPVVRPPTEPSEAWFAALSLALDPRVFPVDLIVGKLQEIAIAKPALAYTYLKAIPMYRWVLVDPALVDVPDEDTVIDHDPTTLVQLAIRRDRIIRIHSANWRRLSPEGRAALVFHEISYALMPVESTYAYLPGYEACFSVPDIDLRQECMTRLTSVRYAQRSGPARNLVGFLFSYDLSALDPRIAFPPVELGLLQASSVTEDLVKGAPLMTTIGFSAFIRGFLPNSPNQCQVDAFTCTNGSDAGIRPETWTGDACRVQGTYALDIAHLTAVTQSGIDQLVATACSDPRPGAGNTVPARLGGSRDDRSCHNGESRVIRGRSLVRGPFRFGNGLPGVEWKFEALKWNAVGGLEVQAYRHFSNHSELANQDCRTVLKHSLMTDPYVQSLLQLRR